MFFFSLAVSEYSVPKWEEHDVKIQAESQWGTSKRITSLVLQRKICYPSRDAGDVICMVIRCMKLLKLVIDKGLSKPSLQRLTGMSSPTVMRLSKNETVNTDSLLKICKVLKCDISDIMNAVEVEGSIGTRTRL